MHVEKASETVQATLNLGVLESLDSELVITRRHVRIDDVNVTDLLAKEFVGAKGPGCRGQLKNGVVHDKVRSNFEIESLSLVESKVIAVHVARVHKVVLGTMRVADQRVVVIRLLIRIDIQLSVLGQGKRPLVLGASCKAFPVELTILLLYEVVVGDHDGYANLFFKEDTFRELLLVRMNQTDGALAIFL